VHAERGPSAARQRRAIDYRRRDVTRYRARQVAAAGTQVHRQLPRLISGQVGPVAAAANYFQLRTVFTGSTEGIINDRCFRIARSEPGNPSTPTSSKRRLAPADVSLLNNGPKRIKRNEFHHVKTRRDCRADGPPIAREFCQVSRDARNAPLPSRGQGLEKRDGRWRDAVKNPNISMIRKRRESRESSAQLKSLYGCTGACNNLRKISPVPNL